MGGYIYKGLELILEERALMKKKILLFAIICIFSVTGCACSGKNGGHESVSKEKGAKASALPETGQAQAPDISQIRSICELATLECYYHNVAISTKEKGSGLPHIWEKEREFWIEYSGVAKLGINISKVSMKIDGSLITVTVPKAELLGLSDYSFSKDSYISEDDGINKNPITPENQTGAVKAAQEDIKKKFAKDDAMLIRAQDRAKNLIENYINQIGQISEKDYQIKWVYEDNLSENKGK